MSSPGDPNNGGRPRLLLGAVVGLVLTVAGCTRFYYRNQADYQAAAVLKEKDQNPAWKIEQYHVYPDPRARFADPTNPDRPPMPYDDAGADALSPHPQNPGKAGVATLEGDGYMKLLTEWDQANRAERKKREEAEKAAAATTAVPPTIVAAAGLPATPSTGQTYEYAATEGPEGVRPYLIKLEQSVELGLINAREYQDIREELYLTALEVTRERFSFAPQFFAIEEGIRQRSGQNSVAGEANNWQSSSQGGVAQLFSTGALLLVNFANQTVITLSGAGKHTVSVSNVNLDMVQPLLRGGGRAVTLEPLTQAERNLLYEVRLFARFRKTFFVAIAGGGGGSLTGAGFVPNSVIGNPNFLPDAPYGSSGLAPGSVVPGTLPAAQTNANGLLLPATQAGELNLNQALPITVSGYLGTMLQYVAIDIDLKNILKLKEFLGLFEGYKEGGVVSELQVNTVEQSLLTGQSTMLTDVRTYGNAIDQFKLQLGLPLNIALEMDDTAVRPLLQQFRRFEAVFAQFDAAEKAATDLGDLPAVAGTRAGLRQLFESAAIVRGTSFRAELPARWASWEKLNEKALDQRLAMLTEERRRLLDRKTDYEVAKKPFPPADQKRLNEVEADIELGGFERALRDYEAEPWKTEKEPARRARLQTTNLRTVVNGFMQVLSEARNQRIDQINQQWPPVPPICLDGTDMLAADEERAFTVASQAALANRLDLMNVRAQLVDAWRQLAVFANALLGVFNVQYLSTSTTPIGQAQPLAFGGTRSEHQLIFNAQLPLVRKLEQLNYRASLIGYQRQRRALQEAEDLAVQAVRAELRQLRNSHFQYRIQQRQVELAYRTVESSLDTFRAPPGVNPAGTGTIANDAQAAALTSQLLNAQTRVPLAQKAILTVWITYLNTRFQLYRDMELMPMDYRGVWQDDTVDCQCPGKSDAGGKPEPLPRSGQGPELLPPPRPIPPAPTATPLEPKNQAAGGGGDHSPGGGRDRYLPPGTQSLPAIPH